MPRSDEQDLAYRRALGCFATGVTVVTTHTGQGPVGVTVNSFTSVSLRPRIILWCLDEASERGGAFLRAEHFAVNILGLEQRETAVRCAEPGGGFLPLDAFEPGGRAPQLRNALAWFQCRALEHKAMGDHQVLFGEVEAFGATPGSGLTYFRGAYGSAVSPVEQSS